MKPDRAVARDVDEYIAGFPPEVQDLLAQIRSTIREAAPEAKEAIKYQIPTYTLKGNLVSFAAYKNHIGLYPVPAGTKKFQKELAIYRAAKSTAKFPLDQPIPFDLIRQLVKFRVKESSGRSSAKGATR
jgi:uncharacterized protein YdhG (YjbR/CyaY superfamily)